MTGHFENPRLRDTQTVNFKSNPVYEMKRINHKTAVAIKRFFAGRESSLKLFNSLLQTIEEICSPEIEVTKTQISFGEKYKYIWIWLPQTWIKKRSENSITLTIMTGKKLVSSRIEESVKSKDGYWTHHIIIESIKDIDKDIEDLIRLAYDFYLERLDYSLRQRTKKEART